MTGNYATEVPACYGLHVLAHCPKICLYGLRVFYKLLTIKDARYIYSQRSRETMVERGGRV